MQLNVFNVNRLPHSNFKNQNYCDFSFRNLMSFATFVAGKSFTISSL